LLKAVGDLIGVIAIVPFLSVLSNPEFVRTNRYASEVYEFFGFRSPDAFLLAFGLALVLFLFLNAGVRSFVTYAINRWSFGRGHSLACRVLQQYLRQPYVFFLDRHSAELANHILGETQRVVGLVYRPVADLFSAAMTTVLLLALLVWREPFATGAAVIVFGGSYLALFVLVRPRLRRLGDVIYRTGIEKSTITWELLSGIKQIRLSARERNYLDSFKVPSGQGARANATATTLRQVPKFVLEGVAFGGIILFTVTLVARSGSAGQAAISQALPTLGLFAMAGYRLLPNLQIIYNAVSTIKLGAPAVDAIHESLFRLDSSAGLPATPPKPLGLREKIEIRHVTVRYPGASAPSLSDVSFSVDRGMTLGIVGMTGSGKSTLADVLLGLLEPESGEVVVDGTVLDRTNIRSWRSSVGYVPQQVFIAEGDVAGNVALGVPPAEVSEERLLEATAMAQIHRLVLEKMADGFQTRVGQAGVKLSGGERQRIGIARALYDDPDVIVFDEATSALDNLTERRIIDDIRALSGRKTVIMIAHRLSTVRHCDMILVLENGRIVGLGGYDDLHSNNAKFRSISMAAAQP
jgi:ABC-type multidrug transport system fused ATPase/permease subunit